MVPGGLGKRADVWRGCVWGEVSGGPGGGAVTVGRAPGVQAHGPGELAGTSLCTQPGTGGACMLWRGM